MKKIILSELSLLIFVSLLFTTRNACAAPGDLDTNFAGTGKVMTSFGFGDDMCQAAVVQPDSKLVLAGFSDTSSTGGIVELVRVNSSGQLDTSFGVNGKVQTGGYSNATVKAVAVQPDGNLVVAGSITTNSYGVFALWRYTTNGALDTSFGTNGMVLTDWGVNAQIFGVAVQPDGKIIAVGDNFSSGFALTRYNTNGALDNSFGSGGKVTASAGGDATAFGVRLPGDGTILACGTGGSKFALLSFTTNGVLNSAFGGGTGQVFTNFGYQSSESAAYAITIQPAGLQIGQDAKIVAVGLTEPTFSTEGIAVARYNLDGSFDTTFGTNGIVVKTFTSGPGDTAVGVVATRSGSVIKIAVGASGFTGTNYFFEVMKLNAVGALDTTFNGTGLKTMQFGRGFEDQPYAMVNQLGNYVLAGSSLVNTSNSDFAAVRFNSSDGSLDTNFNGTGILTVDIADQSSSAFAVAKQPDGKYVATGSAFNGATTLLALARYNTDGSLDSSFGTAGKVITPTVTNLDGQGAGVTVQTDGKIVVACGSHIGNADFFALARYSTNGTLDASFGTNGTLLTLVGNSAVAFSTTVQSDGKILAGGAAYNGTDDDFAAVRYLTNGALDTTFNSTGKVTTGIASGQDSGQAILVQPDGKIVVAGFGTINANIEIAAVRYLTNGTLDPVFGASGRVATPVSGQNLAAGVCMTIQTNNRIIVAGEVLNSFGTEFAAVRYLTNGSLDTSFNSTGTVVLQIGLSRDIVDGVAMQSDGKILLAGVSQTGPYNEFAAARLNPDGTIDTSYGFGGHIVQTFNTGGDEYVGSVVLDSNNGALMAGTAGNQFALMKLQGNLTLKILSITHLGNGHNLLTGIGAANGSHTLLATPSLKTNFTTLGPVSADGSGNWQYEDASLTGVTNRFYRLSYP